MVKTGLMSMPGRAALAVVAIASTFLLAADRPPTRDDAPPPSDRSNLQGTEQATESASSRTASIEHGRYLVHHVAMCIKCHSPKTDRGGIVETELLEGGRITVESPFSNQEWALRAPHLEGLPGRWTEADMAHFLQTGETPTGFPIRPPMPPFRMNAHDAKSVAVYLHSLASP